jgi:hypothetical protein
MQYLKRGEKSNLMQDGNLPFASYVVSIKGSDRPTWIRSSDLEYATAGFNHFEKHGTCDNFLIKGRE